MTRKLHLFVLIIILSFINTSCVAAPQETPLEPISFHTADWDSIRLVNAIASFIITEGYGYPVDLIPTPEKILAQSLNRGEVDASLEVWTENHPQVLKTGIESGQIIDLGLTYQDASQYFIIPMHIAKQHNISTMEDMKAYWYLFQDPEDPYRGLFYPGLVSWFVTDTNIEKIKKYGLEPYYNSITLPSGRSFEKSFMSAADQDRPIFGHYWAPSTVMGLEYWKILKEPEDPSCDGTNGSENETPLLCPFKNSQVKKLVSPGLIERAPDVVEFIKQFDPGTKEISRTLAWGYNQNITDYNIQAREYLVQNDDRVQSWVSPDAYSRIQSALHDPGEAM